MTDSILRSYYNVSSSTFVPFVFTEPTEGALHLLDGETDGFAIDATTYDDITAAAYVGGPVGGTVAVINTGDPTDDLDNVPLNASNLVQSGTSPKMVHHLSSPYVRWSPHNLFPASQNLADFPNNRLTFTDNAAVAPDGTLTADLATETTANGLHRVSHDNLTYVVGVPYTMSAYFKKSTRDYLGFVITDGGGAEQQIHSFNVNTGSLGTQQTVGTLVTFLNATITSAGSGWYRCTLTVRFETGATAGGFFYNVLMQDATTTSYAGDAGESGYIWGAQLNRGDIATPYLATTTAARIGIPQSYDTAAAQYGVLVEPAATNLCLYSEQFNNAAWASIAGTIATITADNTTAPDGSSNADKVDDVGAGALERVGQTLAVSTATVYTWSVYIKAGTATYTSLIADDAIGSNTVLAIWRASDGAISDSGNEAGTGHISSSSTSVGGGWYRITLTFTTQSTSYQFKMFVARGSSGTVAGGNEASATGYSYLWGAQAEVGSVATSYIPTLGSTVTRARDLITVATSTFNYSATEDTMYFDGKSYGALASEAGIGPRLMVIQDSANQATDEWGVGVSTTNGRFEASESGAQSADFNIAGYTSGARNQLTFAAKTNDFAGSINNSAVTTDNTDPIPTTMNRVIFGELEAGVSGGGARPLLISRVVIVPRRVVDGSLPTWRYNF